MSAVAIVPAAGKGERFGGAKLMVRFKGEPLINWTLWSLLDGGVGGVVVVTAPGADFFEAPLMNDPRVSVAVNEDPSRGMFSSIQAGLSITGGDPLVILPADMPFIASSTITEIVLACIRRHRVIIPMHQDRRGHPIAIPAFFRKPLLLAPPETTLKHALAAAGADPVELPVADSGILKDVDTPADLDR
jgi:molybdenum cofactor cytidylyltransferase